MSAYYYFRATLPSLLPGTAPPMSPADFLAKAFEFLSPDDFAVLSSARLFIPEDGLLPANAGASPLLRAYYAWERALRNELAGLRAGRQGKAPEHYLRPGTPEREASRAARAAAAMENPLEAELLIERERWAAVDRLETGHYFDLEHLIAYSLKLQALERRARFAMERGEPAFATAYDSILKDAARGRAERA